MGVSFKKQDKTHPNPMKISWGWVVILSGQRRHGYGIHIFFLFWSIVGLVLVCNVMVNDILRDPGGFC